MDSFLLELLHDLEIDFLLELEVLLIFAAFDEEDDVELEG